MAILDEQFSMNRPHGRGSVPPRDRETNLPLAHELISGPAFWLPDRWAESAWIGHLPFAFWVVEALKPGILVELGTHRGTSYSALCQAVQRLELGTRCFAIDTWTGDEHAGFYGEEVFEEFSRYHDAHFGGFSRLIRSTFDEAAPAFTDGSIDLLHIDGCHRYEIVQHDFETWRPKLSEHAIVLFHDTDVRRREFGVWRLWEELSASFPAFEFKHSYGLGVLGYGRNVPVRIRQLLDASRNQSVTEDIRQRFQRLGDSLNALAAERKLATALDAESAKAKSLEADRASGQRLIEDLQQGARAQADEIDALKQRDARNAQKIGLLTERASHAEIALEASSKELAEVRSDLMLREAQLSDISRNNTNLNIRLAEAETALGHQRTLHQQLLARLATMEASLPWRIASVSRQVLSGAWNFMSGTKRKERRKASRLRREIIASGLFDGAWYLATYPDVAANGLDPIRHYVKYGAAEGRNPSPSFDAAQYLEQHLDVKESGKNPLIHYIRYGQAEGRKTSPVASAKARGAAPAPDLRFLSPLLVATQDGRAQFLEAVRRLSEPREPVTIVVPIYNALDHMRACIESVLKHTRGPYRLILIDDASSDPDIRPYLKNLCQNPSIEIVLVDKNGGYTRTANRGLQLAGRSDVVLLNSDTIATPRWLENLRFAAYSDARTGTATPLSNIGLGKASHSESSFPATSRSPRAAVSSSKCWAKRSASGSSCTS
jgi:hypothetical protein